MIIFRTSLAGSPDSRGAHVELGEVLLSAGKLTRADSEFEEELRIAPHRVRSVVRRGEAKLIQNDLDGALQDWSTAVATDGLQAARVLGIRETGLGDAAFELLPDALRAKIEKLPPELQQRDSPAAHLALAFLAMQAGNSSLQAAEGERALSSSRAASSAMSCSQAEVERILKQEQFSALSHCTPQVVTHRRSASSSYAVAHALFEAGEYEVSLRLLSDLPPPDQHSSEASYCRDPFFFKVCSAYYFDLCSVSPTSFS